MKVAPLKVQPFLLPYRVYQVYRYMSRTGSISARDAMIDLGLTSASLARRICDLEERGYGVIRIRKNHPVTGQQYTRYVLQENA